MFVGRHLLPLCCRSLWWKNFPIPCIKIFSVPPFSIEPRRFNRSAVVGDKTVAEENLSSVVGEIGEGRESW